jgi:hypothetical protein
LGLLKNVAKLFAFSEFMALLMGLHMLFSSLCKGVFVVILSFGLKGDYAPSLLR